MLTARRGARPRRPYDRVQRVVDVLLAATGLLLTSPLQLVVALVVRQDVGAPVLFRQIRPGLDGALFELVKFRTMREPSAQAMSDDQRLTRTGRLLRATSVDELPTLWNVLRGDMSIVGPRPLLPSYLALYTLEQARRHEVRPGITGLAQVRGRNALPWEERLQLDVEYVDTRGPLLDLRIMGATATAVLSRRGVTGPGSATVEPFLGPLSPEARP